MASSKTRTRTVRISNESADYFEKLPLNKVIEGVYTLIFEKKIVFDGENLKISEKSGLTPNKDLEEIESMAKFFGMDVGELLKGVCDGLMDGNLTVENGKVVGVPEVNLEKLEEACHERGIGMQEAIDKLVLTMKKGK